METQETEKKSALKLKDMDETPPEADAAGAEAMPAPAMMMPRRKSGDGYMLAVLLAVIAVVAFAVAVMLQSMEMSYYRDAFPVSTGTVSP